MKKLEKEKKTITAGITVRANGVPPQVALNDGSEKNRPTTNSAPRAEQ